MAEKQSHLNGAYYGPSIPPPHRPRRGCGCGCCLLTFVLKLIIALVVLIGLAVLIFWLIFRPNRVKFYVTDASLTEFNYTTGTNSNVLYYNLDVNLTIRNPNKAIGIYYDRIEVRALYEGQRLGSQYLTPFYQGHKTTSHLNAGFRGQQVMLLGGEDLIEFNQEKASGIYSIDVKLYLKIRFKVGKIRVGKFKPKVECDLKLPLSSVNGSLVGAVRSTKCDIDF